MKFDPKTIFWVTFAVGVGHLVASGTVHLSGLIPAELVAPATGWISALTLVGLAWLGMATGYAGVGRGPLAGPPTPEDVRDLQSQAGIAPKAEPLTPPAPKQ